MRDCPPNAFYCHLVGMVWAKGRQHFSPDGLWNNGQLTGLTQVPEEKLQPTTLKSRTARI